MAHAFTPPGMKTLNLGDKAPPFNLKGVDGEMYSLDSFKEYKHLMVFFTCNHCPSAQAVEGRFKEFVAKYRPQGLGVVAISPNSPLGIRPEELGYSSFGDSYEDMIAHAKAEGFNFPYIYDGDTQEVAKSYGCLATPHVFLFDEERTLRYKGRFDDSHKVDPSTIHHHDAINATEALLAGKDIPVKQTKPHGCSTKWKEKAVQVKKHEENLLAKPVIIKEKDAEGIKALLGSSPNIRLINVWATWCPPCRIEFPDLVAISRKFGMRNVELITISMDDLKNKDAAAKFLKSVGVAPSRNNEKFYKKSGRETSNFLFTGSMQEIADIVNPGGSGPILPFSVLLDTQGNIVGRYEGMIEKQEVIDDIVELVGKYFK